MQRNKQSASRMAGRWNSRHKCVGADTAPNEGRCEQLSAATVKDTCGHSKSSYVGVTGEDSGCHAKESVFVLKASQSF